MSKIGTTFGGIFAPIVQPCSHMCNYLRTSIQESIGKAICFWSLANLAIVNMYEVICVQLSESNGSGQ